MALTHAVSLQQQAAARVEELAAAEELAGGMLHEPFTNNVTCFNGAKQEFLQRLKDKHHGAVTHPSAGSIANTNLTTAMSNLRGVPGLAGVQAEQVLRSLQSDEYDSALDAMATTLAYFRLASRRFVDAVPMAIRMQLVRPLAAELGEELTAGVLGMEGGGDVAAAALIVEDSGLAHKRARLEGRAALLRNVKALLDEI